MKTIRLTFESTPWFDHKPIVPGTGVPDGSGAESVAFEASVPGYPRDPDRSSAIRRNVSAFAVIVP